MIRMARGEGTGLASDRGNLSPAIEQACDELRSAIDQGGIGDIVAKHEKLILHYYQDVQDQAKKSFATARSVSLVGFAVLIGTVAYALSIDAVMRLGGEMPVAGEGPMSNVSLAITGVGLVSGMLIEFIAAVTFWLYARGAKQFGAFHICLERTHRYLLAYKIAEQIDSQKDETLQKLVCIMANAPMISHADIEGPNSAQWRGSGTQAPLVSTEVNKF